VHGNNNLLPQNKSGNNPQVTLLRAGRNLGFAGGNNLGIRKAQGDIIVLLNDDTEVAPDWLSVARRSIESLPDWGILGAKLLYPDKTTIQHAGGTIQPNALTQHIGNGEIDIGQYDTIKQCDYVTGAAFFIRREVVDTIGLLDEGYFPIYFEEVDYCFRARAAGYEVYYVPGIKVLHYESRTTKKLSRGFLYNTACPVGRTIIYNYNLQWRIVTLYNGTQTGW